MKEKKIIKDSDKKKYKEKIKIETNFNDTIKAMLNTKPEKKVKIKK